MWTAKPMSPASHVFALLTRIAASPAQALAAILLLHTLVWTALPTLLYPNLPLDLIEALTYGREWQLGHDKLPPLPWWLVEIVYRAVGRDFAYYLLSQLAVVAALWLVWLTAIPLAGERGALVAALIADGLHYLNYTSVKFNHDVIQLPLWALAGLAFHRALRGGWLGHWLLLGVAVGMALWAKYFVVVLAAPLALFVFFDREARKTLATPGPYVAAAVALITAAPHIVWLVQNDFLPFAYAEHRALPSRGLIDHLWHPLEFAHYQFLALLPSLLIALPLFYPRQRKDTPAKAGPDAFDLRISTLLAWGPVASVLALSAISGRGTVPMWSCPIWLFLGLWLVLVARSSLDDRRLFYVVATWAVVFTGLALGFFVNYAVLPYYDHRYRANFFPGRDLGREISQRYQAATGEPISYVIGSMWDGGNVAHCSPGRPRVLIDGKPERAPWIDLEDLKAKGAVVVFWQDDLHAMPPEFKAIADGAVVQQPIELRYLRADLRGDPIVRVGWAILYPKPRSAAEPVKQPP
jgi:4-amino-4-deoxy-L-arabinose transferase-like glycosyltransferase